jgi:hypothetical protein
MYSYGIFFYIAYMSINMNLALGNKLRIASYLFQN